MHHCRFVRILLADIQMADAPQPENLRKTARLVSRAADQAPRGEHLGAGECLHQTRVALPESEAQGHGNACFVINSKVKKI